MVRTKKKPVETKEEFKDRTSQVIPGTGEYNGYVIKCIENTFDIFLEGQPVADHFETPAEARAWIDDHPTLSPGPSDSKIDIIPPPPGSDQSPSTTEEKPIQTEYIGHATRLGIQKRMLDCYLDDDEFVQCSIQLAEMQRKIADEEERQKAIKTELKSSMEALEKEREDLANSVLTRKTRREVDVAIEMLGDGETISEIRLDTHTGIATRPATDYERQGRMFPDDDDMFRESED